MTRIDYKDIVTLIDLIDGKLDMFERAKYNVETGDEIPPFLKDSGINTLMKTENKEVARLQTLKDKLMGEVNKFSLTISMGIESKE